MWKKTPRTSKSSNPGHQTSHEVYHYSLLGLRKVNDKHSYCATELVIAAGFNRQISQIQILDYFSIDKAYIAGGRLHTSGIKTSASKTYGTAPAPNMKVKQ